ncbi:serine/threonine protein kinase [Pelomyxa schiedti]|nr:serine/threonine protein kinase [Pelomyxa schiedti]
MYGGGDTGRPLENFEFVVGRKEPRGFSLFRLTAEYKGDPRMFYALGQLYMKGQGTDQDTVLGMHYLNRAADAGNVEALWELSGCYLAGSYGIQADIFKSIPYLQKGADAGHSGAMYVLGGCFLHGLGVEIDLNKAAALFQRASDLGVADARVALGELYMHGKGVPVDEKKALSLFLRTVNDPRVGWQAQLNLSDFYLYGTAGVRLDVEKGISYLKKAVKKGKSTALFRLGRCYDLGIGVEKDTKKAIDLYQRSAEGGCFTAMYSLSEHYLEGNGVPLDQEKAISLLQKSAKMNDRQALWRLGRCYDKGEGVEKDVKKAVELYQKSVASSFVVAMYHLSEHYMNGEGVAFDPDQAVSLLKRASNDGYTPAMRQLAQCYKEGKGVNVDLTKALSLLKNAADAGDTQAMMELSDHYTTGEGIPADVNRAVSLIQRAYEKGSIEAGVSLGWGLLMGAHGMKRNVHRAIPILKKVAEESCDARTMLALCYECGLGVSRHVKRADTIFREIVDKGYISAIIKVAKWLERGEFRAPKDVAKAYQLYTRAACAGDKSAQRRLFELLMAHLDDLYEEVTSPTPPKSDVASSSPHGSKAKPQKSSTKAGASSNDADVPLLVMGHTQEHAAVDEDPIIAYEGASNKPKSTKKHGAKGKASGKNKEKKD